MRLTHLLTVPAAAGAHHPPRYVLGQRRRDHRHRQPARRPGPRRGPRRTPSAPSPAWRTATVPGSPAPVARRRRTGATIRQVLTGELGLTPAQTQGLRRAARRLLQRTHRLPGRWRWRGALTGPEPTSARRAGARRALSSVGTGWDGHNGGHEQYLRRPRPAGGPHRRDRPGRLLPRPRRRRRRRGPGAGAHREPPRAPRDHVRPRRRAAAHHRAGADPHPAAHRARRRPRRRPARPAGRRHGDDRVDPAVGRAWRDAHPRRREPVDLRPRQPRPRDLADPGLGHRGAGSTSCRPRAPTPTATPTTATRAPSPATTSRCASPRPPTATTPSSQALDFARDLSAAIGQG